MDRTRQKLDTENVTKIESLKRDQERLLSWYRQGHRPLPWRKNRDVFRIWISETMLQQTTSAAVIPYFERFIEKFPTLHHLAKASETEVLKLWAGLGYYSRARNLHRAAQLLAEMSTFPRTYQELIELPGFGPYTARAVSSLAFDEPVGVLDGNVIRVLSRHYLKKVEWWTGTGRKTLQELVDHLVSEAKSSGEVNQALMELGATVCLPQNPKCLLCPWLKSCSAYKHDQVPMLPLKKPKRAREIWHWEAYVHRKKDKLALIRNNYAPFLKGQWILPGQTRKLRKKPPQYDFMHSITHHDIFVTVIKSPLKMSLPSTDTVWVNPESLAEWTPASLVRKALGL